MLILNKDNFKAEVLESKIPVLVDFHAIGCGPCRTLDPILRKLEEINDKVVVKFTKIEAGDALDVFSEYSVTSVPTMIIFKDGQVVDRKKGLMNEKDITEWLVNNG